MSFTTVLYILNIIATIVIIFVERKRPSATLAWIMILFVLPGVGFVLYVILSQFLARARLSNLSSSMVMKSNPYILDQKHRMAEGSFRYGNAQAAKWSQLIKFNQSYAGSYLTQDNDVELFASGQECFNSMFEDLKAAKKSINMEFYIMKPDYIGEEIINILTRKAKEGVKVRLLLDAMGCREMRREHYKALKKAGGEVVFFLPAKIFKLDLKLNYRNHRKILVIDSEIGYIGGLNAAREYVGDTKRFGGWRDTHLRFTGGAVFDLDARFLMDWNFASGKGIEQNVDDYNPAGGGRTIMQIVSSGPDSDETEIKFLYLKMITGARHSICLQSPYMVPDESIFEALKTAALSGVDVNIMIPKMPDHPFVYWVTYQNVGKLLDYGAKIYIYDRGFLHAKTLTVDDEVSSVGSANFDIRSFELNFESNAVIYDRDFAVKMRHIFMDDVRDSKRLTKEAYRKRSRIIKIKESISRLVSDIL